MRFRHLDHSLHKTLAFAGVHVVNAVLVGWWFTGSFALAGVIALVEPAVNSVVHYRLDHWWNAPQRRTHGPLARTAVFAVAHLLVVLSVGGAITGSFVLAGAYAVVEPAANTVAHFFFERWWKARRPAGACSGVRNSWLMCERKRDFRSLGLAHATAGEHPSAVRREPLRTHWGGRRAYGCKRR